MNEWNYEKLGAVSQYATDRINVKKINLDNYISTENMLPEKAGITVSSGLPNIDSIVPAYKCGDVLISNIRPYFKKIWFSDKDGGCSNDVLVFRAKQDVYEKKFLYYVLSSDNFFDYSMSTSKGTKMPRGDKSALMNYSVPLCPLPEQRAIADTLSCLDDMIELNNRTNKVLEEMAQAIFKRWFIDFEFPDENGTPYKSSGGAMEESELGEMPVGWRVGTLGEMTKSIDNRGKTPPFHSSKTTYPVIDVKALSGESRIIDFNNCTKFVTEETYNNWFRNGHPKKYDILISTVGSVAEMKLFNGEIGCIAQNVVGLRSINISALYLYQLLQFIKDDLIAYNIGSVQPSIKVTHIIRHNILLPDKNLLLKFHQILEPISNEIYNNSLNSQSLKDIRDSLLPKLMSGEIRVGVEEG